MTKSLVSSRGIKRIAVVGGIAIGALVVLGGTSAVAADTFAKMQDNAEGINNIMGVLVKAFQFVLAFTPIFGAYFFSSKVKEYLENKEEQGQYQPKATKNFMIVSAAVIGVLASYLFVGIIGKVFVNKPFEDSWQFFVASVWESWITGTPAPNSI